jgi:hypothetical protein
VAGRDITEGDSGVYSSYDGSGVSTVARGVADIGILSSTSTWQNTDVAYDVALGGLPFIYAINDARPYIRQTAPFRKDQFDNGQEPGEQSLTGWWIRSQMSFHSGSGINFYDPATTDENGHYRFKESKGINVWTKGQATLLKNVTAGHVTTGPIATNGVAQQHLRSIKWSTFTGALLQDEYDVDKIKVTDPSNPVHFIDYTAGAGVYPVYAICDDGTNAYWITNKTSGATTKLTVFGKPLTGSSASTADEFKVFDNSQIITNGVMEYVKQRLVICADNKVYECAAAVTSTPSLVYTNPSTAHVYTSITASGTAIYISGYNGPQSTIEKYTIVTTAGSVGTMPVLSQAVIAAELPVGEIVHKIYYYLGRMMIGTNKGIRVAQVSDQDGSILYGPLIVETTQPCYDFAARDHYVWCATSVAGEPGLIRIDLSNELETLRFAWANDIYYGGTTGHVTTAVCFDGNTDPTTTDRLMFATAYASSADGAVYVEDASTLMTNGYITTGNIRYGTLEPKNFKRLLGRGEFTYGSMTLETVDKNNVEYDHISYDSAISPIEVGTSSPATAQEYVAYKFILYRDGTDTTKGPTFKGYQAKATIATPRQRVMRFPVYCFDVETDKYNTVVGYEGRAFDRIQSLEDVEETGDVITWQDLSTGESRQAVIEQVTFTRMTPPDKRFDGFGGVLEITIRTV